MQNNSDTPTKSENTYEERVLNIDRVARVVKGGRRFRFRALVTVGDRKGKVGMGIAKGSDVTSAITKASDRAKKAMINVPLYKHGTIPHDVLVRHAGAKVLFKPAGEGTGLIAGGAIREILEVAGVTDILSKSLGSSNRINTAYATILALSQLDDFGSAPKQSKPKKATTKS